MRKGAVLPTDEPKLPPPPADPPPANDDEPAETAARKKSAIVTVKKRRRSRFRDVPDMGPEEHRRRGEAADALFREMMRRTIGKP